MPKDLKIGVMIAVGVFLVCGAKRISIDPEALDEAKDRLARRFDATTDDGAIALALPEAPRISVDGPIDLDPDRIEESAKDVERELSEALANDFPQDLREKVEQASDDFEADMPVLALPEMEIDEPKISRPSQAEPKRVVRESSRSSLPPVQTKDVVRTRGPSSNDWASDRAAPKRAPEPPDFDLDFTDPADSLPKALPDADDFGTGPVHPYFRRFLREGSYYVRDGDTLAGIAHNLYGKETMADEILASNRSLLSSPRDLRPGMRLTLPKR